MVILGIKLHSIKSSVLYMLSTKQSSITCAGLSLTIPIKCNFNTRNCVKVKNITNNQ